ncbi:MBL fold metallo-hydrolase [Coraliomargarita parva]|uniref:MBL fold metallo-hydrolase n=1 Tax=Coraliomargarita parva TaxID=3014050 RepID=UPI0022B4F319|nr:MBL fold metallo-hydrolase [Coraliomargarita parva]
MKLIDLNRHGGIGANSIFVQIGDFNILVDAGLHPKMVGKEALPDFEPIEDLDLDLIILTHCHLDHLGGLPIVASLHPDAPIITSLPNLTLAPRMLRNSINVMKRQRQELNILDYPLFLHRDVAAVSKRLVGQRFERGEVYLKGKDRIEVTLHPAGHVAGAAAVEFIHKHRRIVFSGDVLFEAQRTLPGAHLPKGKIDTLILETTRGRTARKPEVNRASEVDRLIDTVAAILERGGSCLIPVFALGRMQELFKILYEARNFGRLPRCPVFAAGLGIDLCNHFEKIRRSTRLVDFDLGMLEKMRVQQPDPKMRPGRDLPRKGIYLVSSGMMVEHTPSYHIAASLLPHPDNGICFVGYCDPETPGGEILAEPEAENYFFDALDYLAPRQASVDQFDLSGHADREELAAYAVQSEARAVVLTHGDADAREWFLEELQANMPDSTVINPEPLCQYQI